MTRKVISMPPQKTPRGPGERSEQGLMRTLLKVAAVLFLAEIAVMCVLPLLGLHGIWEAVADGLLLTILALPVLYLLGFRSSALIEARDLRQSSRLERRMLFLLGANVALIVALFTVYALLATGQESGVKVINVAGRQQMLSQRLVQAGMAEAMERAHTTRKPRTSGAIADCSTQFERALHGLVKGDPGLGLPRCLSDEAVRQLKAVGEAWKPFRALVERTSDPSNMEEASAYYVALQENGDRVLTEMNKAVSILEEHYEVRARLLSNILGLIIVAAAGISMMLAVAIRRVMRYRTQIEAALKESEAKTRAIVENAADGIITIDERGTIEEFNTAAQQIFGCEAGEVVGKNISMLMPSPYREEHDTYLLRYLETGVQTILDGRREVTGRRKDGSTFPMDLCVSEARVGDRHMFTGIVRDITKRKQAEEEIARQNRFLNTVIESLDHPFLVIDAEDHSVLMANAAVRRDAAPEAKTCHAMTHHRDTPCDGLEDPCPLAEIKRTGRSMMVEHTHYQADGSLRTVEVHAYPVFDEDGRVVQVIEYSLDITERKRTEVNLQQAKQTAEAARDALMESVEELEAFNRLAVGRELRMIELKKEVNELSESQGMAPKYEIVNDEVTA